MVSISFVGGNKFKSNFSKAQNSYQMTISLIMMVIMMCAVSSLITMAKMNESSSSKLEPVSVSDDIRDDAELGPVPVDAPTDDIEIFSIDSEIRMYEKCNSNSKIISEMAMNVGSWTSSDLPPEGFLNTSENEKVRMIEVKNVEILPGSKWTVVSNNNQGVKGETTVILDYAQGYMGNETQVLDVGYVEKDEYGVGKCSDNAESYIKDINLIYIPMKTRVKSDEEVVEGYSIM
jgi:hypothetical protein